MKRAYMILFASLLAANIASAASFDCAKASTRVEKMICADPELSKLDEELSAAYNKALKESSDPSALKQQQQHQWLQTRDTDCSTRECIKIKYQIRIEGLTRLTRTTVHRYEKTAFIYDLSKGANNKVCEHMQKVLNQEFRSPWLSEQEMVMGIDPGTGLAVAYPNPAYAANGKYAFSKRSNVAHSDGLTFQMRHSKLPTSPEFEVIDWSESRLMTSSHQQGKLQPILVADFDVDNDGEKETVLKTDFFANLNVYGAHAGNDVYHIFPQGKVALDKPVTFQELLGHNSQRIEGMFMRPFIIYSKTYFISYVRTWGASKPESQHVAVPVAERMLIVSFGKKRKSNTIKKNALALPSVICEYEMLLP